MMNRADRDKFNKACLDVGNKLVTDFLDHECPVIMHGSIPEFYSWLCEHREYCEHYLLQLLLHEDYSAPHRANFSRDLRRVFELARQA